MYICVSIEKETSNAEEQLVRDRWSTKNEGRCVNISLFIYIFEKKDMKKLVYILSISILAMSLSSCEKCSRVPCESGNVVGSYCNDGTTSTSTGPGTCSGHGGVQSLMCEECE
jgi:hypothetical protein